MRWLLLFLTFAVSAAEYPRQPHQTPHRIRITPEYDDNVGYQSQTEVNIYHNRSFVNQAVEWEEDDLTIGAYFNNIPLMDSPYATEFVDDSYLGFFKWWGDAIKFGVGHQLGTQFSGESQRLLAFTTAQIRWAGSARWGASVGVWHGNHAVTQTDQTMGVIVTGVWRWSDEISTEASWYSGRSGLSGAIVNTYVEVTEDIDLYFGVQIPAAGSGNEFAGIVGVSAPLDQNFLPRGAD